VKVIIAGTRTIPPRIADELVELGVRVARLRGWEITEVVWGKARGVDTAAKRWADRNCIPDKPFAADWTGPLGLGAGHVRNGEMARYGEALIAITTGSPGTRNMIQQARARKMPMIVIAASGGAWENDQKF
jgi:hypothetical protein